jgi:transforming growth factor-beta-induced protein
MKKKVLMAMLVVLAMLTIAYAAVERMDVVDTAIKSGNFTTLVTALKATGLVDTLKGEGPFTVFAPTDEAFAKLGEAELAKLLLPGSKEDLTSILNYHIAPEKYTADDMIDMSQMDTLNGKVLSIKIADDAITVDDSKVMSTDIECSNGVIHVIDTVLIP